MDNAVALVVEDDDQLAEIFVEALKAVQYEPEIIANGQAALDRIQEVVPALILLDMHLPKVSGEVVLQAVRSDARLSETIIILATADAQLADIWRDEADLVLLKPVSFNQLRDLAARLHPH